MAVSGESAPLRAREESPSATLREAASTSGGSQHHQRSYEAADDVLLGAHACLVPDDMGVRREDARRRMRSVLCSTLKASTAVSLVGAISKTKLFSSSAILLCLR